MGVVGIYVSDLPVPLTKNNGMPWANCVFVW